MVVAGLFAYLYNETLTVAIHTKAQVKRIVLSTVPLMGSQFFCQRSPSYFFSRFFGSASKWTFRNLEFLNDFGLEFWENP